METLSTHLQFVQNHMPAMDAGDYELKVKQVLTDGDGNTATYDKTLAFSVLGDRFALTPNQVHSVFPPANGLGEYGGVLPHIILKRSTLPWERDAQENNETPPWLALLVFDPEELEVMAEDAPAPPQARLEAQTGYSQEVKDLMTGGFTAKAGFSAAQKGWGGIGLETGQMEDDRVSVIFVKKKNLIPLLPTLDDLTQLAHVRRGTDDQGKLLEEERAVILGKRLPQPGGESVVHLVSLENRYSKDGNFNFHQAGDEEVVPLISLYSWSFASISRKHTFRGLLLHLNQKSVFRVPDSTDLDLDMSRQHVMTSKLRAQFAQVGYPLSEDGATQNTDRSRREIILNDYHFLIGNSGKVYDQGGYFLFQMETITGNAAPEAIIAAIRAKDYTIPLNTVIDELPAAQTHWWLEDTGTGRNYFVRHEGGNIEALQLELDHAPVLRLPETGNPVADRFLHQGYVPMPHYPRQGGKTVSWYRGPLTTSEKRTATLDRNIFAVNTSDELVLYHTDVGLFDVTYAAAWELGRLLALRSKRFSVGLHRWRRTHARAAVQAELHEAHLHLPMSGVNDSGIETFPAALDEWLDRLWDLEGIPYNYLVPDARMLPPESLRFFTLDPDWMACLVHGAFSIGREAGTDHWQENTDQHPVMQQLDARDAISGFLLKSEVVSGYPGMEIEVYGQREARQQQLQVLRRQNSQDLILCLYTGEASEVRFHLKPDVLHFGFEREEDGSNYIKYPHDPEGKVMEESVPVIMDATRRVVDMATLFNSVKAAWNPSDEFGSGHFALALMEGVQQVIYRRAGE